MLGISKETITEKVKDVIFETGLLSPRSAITVNQRFQQDYGLEGAGPIAAFTSQVNARFRPYGKSISTVAMAACVRVSDLISQLAGRTSGLIKKPISLPKKIGTKSGSRTSRKAKVPS
jgi:hypothetical protein